MLVHLLQYIYFGFTLFCRLIVNVIFASNQRQRSNKIFIVLVLLLVRCNEFASPSPLVASVASRWQLAVNILTQGLNPVSHVKRLERLPLDHLQKTALASKNIELNSFYLCVIINLVKQ